MTIQNKSVRVTVIIAAYNAAAYLHIAVDSVLRQTEHNFEIIIVDDCSPDDTWQVAKGYEALDERIRAVRMARNGGQYAAMNHAISLAKGEWIAILDSDDWYQPERLKTVIDEAEAASVNIAADSLLVYDNGAQVVYRHASPPPQTAQLIDRPSFMRKSNPLIYNRADFGTLKPVFRASTAKKHFLKYLEVRNGGDYYFLLSWLLQGEKMLLLPCPSYVYVEPVGLVSRQFSRASRRPYLFLNFKKTNDLFLQNYETRLTPRERRALRIRGRVFVELDRSDRFKKSFEEGRYLEACSILFEAPFILPLVIAARCVHLVRRLRIRKRAQTFRRTTEPFPPSYGSGQAAL